MTTIQNFEERYDKLREFSKVLGSSRYITDCSFKETKDGVLSVHRSPLTRIFGLGACVSWIKFKWCSHEEVRKGTQNFLATQKRAYDQAIAVVQEDSSKISDATLEKLILF